VGFERDSRLLVRHLFMASRPFSGPDRANRAKRASGLVAHMMKVSKSVSRGLTRQSRLRARCLRSLGLAWCCSVSSVAAQEAAPTAFEHEIVVRGTSKTERLRERAFQASVGATVVDSEAVRDEAPMSAADAVRTAAPSVSIQQTTPGQGTIYVRGLSGRAVVYAIDGVRLNMAFFRAGNNDYLGLIDPYSIDSIIVSPGASSVEFGSDALGGAVLTNTETPGFRLETRQRFGALQTLSSNPLGTASRFSVLHEGERTSAYIGFTYYQAGAIRSGEGLRSPDPSMYDGLERNAGDAYAPTLERRQQGTEFEFYGADGTFRQGLARGTSAILKVQFSTRPELVRYDQITPRFKSEYPARAERSLAPLSRAMISAKVENRNPHGLFDHMEAQLAWQRIFERRVDRRLDEHCVEPMADPPLEPETCTGMLRLTPRMERTFEKNRSDAFSLRGEARVANDARSVSVITGIDLHHDIVTSHVETLDLQTLARTPEPPRYPDGSTVSEAALFASSRLRLASAVHTTLGARGSLFFINMASRDSDDAFSRTLADAVGSIGLHWQLAQGLAWFANAARGVRAPNVEDFAALGTRAQGRFQVPNPDIEPEHSYTSDTGFKLERSPHRAQVGVFYTRYAGAIALAPTVVDGAATTPDGEAYYHSVNASSLDLYGAEASFDVAIVAGISTFARALVMRGDQYNPPETGLPQHTPADRIPPAQAELGARYQPWAGAELEAFAIIRAPQRRLNDPINIEDNRIPEGGTPGYTTFHARMKYRINAHVLTRLAFDNVTDRLALDHGSGFYRPGFSVTGGVELNLEPSR
jgi:outer membrane receptor protein involved in Fe transport